MIISVETFMYLLLLEQAGVFADHGVCGFCLEAFDPYFKYKSPNDFYKIPKFSEQKVTEIDWSLA